MTDTDRTIHEDEIDLNDDDDFDTSSSSPSGMNDIPGGPNSDPSPIESEKHFGNHLDRQNSDSTPPKFSNNGTSSSPIEPTEPYKVECNEKPAVVSDNVIQCNT